MEILCYNMKCTVHYSVMNLGFMRLYIVIIAATLVCACVCTVSVYIVASQKLTKCTRVPQVHGNELVSLPHNIGQLQNLTRLILR